MPMTWATRYSSMITPLTAITVFLPTEESHIVRAMDGRRSVRVARAMAMTLGPNDPIGPRHGAAGFNSRKLS
ncbi:hypothetical protein EASAB2608_00944 [Streptomyces sp. EAS-AB2608]|uniref:Uncharacterized protein n=1 Tax=Streptomyces bangladeshensis TaxID=295352 RepID=A0ABN3BEC5_9ACTN|nr:hypothetical protein EASAB2608_00944 [Streptomyces sp. EAS-AB2608]